MKRLLKTLYSYIPFKMQIFTLVKLVWNPPKSIYKHLHFKGPFEVQFDNKRSFKIYHIGYELENEIFWKGLPNGWEKHSMQNWMNLCKDAEVIMDIGANTGIYALSAKAINSKAKVYAFEPVNRIFDKLQKNVKLNNFEIQCEKKGVSDKNGKAVIHDTDTEHTYSVTINRNLSWFPETTFEVEVEIITIDSFVEQNNIDKIDIIKIDVETHEVEVLNGFRKYIYEFEPTLLIEILNDEIAIGIEKIISPIDYYYFNIDENTGIREVSCLGKSDNYNFLICKSYIADRVRKQYNLNY